MARKTVKKKKSWVRNSLFPIATECDPLPPGDYCVAWELEQCRKKSRLCVCVCMGPEEKKELEVGRGLSALQVVWLSPSHPVRKDGWLVRKAGRVPAECAPV